MRLALYLLFSPAILFGAFVHFLFVFAWSGWIIAGNIMESLHK